MDMITQEELKSLLHYDHDTGVFTWKRSRQGSKEGAIAGKVDKRKSGKCYWAITIKYKYYMAHRLVWLYVHGDFPKEQIDHIDGDGLNNRISNLRDVSASENSMNKRKYCNNKSGITGVSWDKHANKWEVQIRVNKKNKRIGRYDNLFEAACARRQADINYGYHNNHGIERGL